MNIASIQRKLDVTAVFLSGVCAVHCLLTPVFIVFFPFFVSSCCDGSCQDSSFHQTMAYIVLPTSCISFYFGCKRHFRKSVVFAGALGLFLIVYAAFWGPTLLGSLGEKTVTTTGGVILAFAHVRNFLLCRQEKKCCHPID